MKRLGAGALLLLSSLASATNVLGTNGCADSMAHAVFGPERLMAWSYASARSNYIPEARIAVQFHGATLEEVLWFSPDVLVTSRRWLSRNAGAPLSDSGISVTRIPYARDWTGVLSVLDSLADESDLSAVITSLESRRQAIPPLNRPVSALYLRPNGGTAGRGTSLATLFELANLDNHAETLGISSWGQLSVESLLVAPPDLFVLGEFTGDDGYAKGQFIRHPAVRALMNRTPMVTIRGQAWGCNNHHLISAAEQLNADARGVMTHD